MAVTVYFCEVDTLSSQWWSLCHSEPSFTCAVQSNSLIRGAGLVCSLAILENVIPRKTVGLVFDSVNNWPFLGGWQEISLTVGKLYRRDSKRCKSCRRRVDWSCGRVEMSRELSRAQRAVTSSPLLFCIGCAIRYCLWLRRCPSPGFEDVGGIIRMLYEDKFWVRLCSTKQYLLFFI